MPSFHCFYFPILYSVAFPILPMLTIIFGLFFSKLGHLNLEKVSTRKTFLARLRLKFPDIAITSTDVHFPQKKGHPSRKFHPTVCKNSSDQYSEVMSSPWYQRTVKKMGLNPLEDLLMPCALYQDFTGVDVYQKRSLGLWMIALLIPKTDVSEKSSSWRHMLMIPDVGKGGQGLSSEEKNRLYHEGLRIGMPGAARDKIFLAHRDKQENPEGISENNC
jgi:hypothetical protein